MRRKIDSPSKQNYRFKKVLFRSFYAASVCFTGILSVGPLFAQPPEAHQDDSGQEQSPAAFVAIRSADGVTNLEGNAPVLTYQRSVKSKDGRWPRNNYIHPLYDLDGDLITEDFPEDHGHHRGLFWAWHQVTIDGQPLGDAWACERFLWDVRSVRAVCSQPEFADLNTDVYWRSPDYQKEGSALPAFVREQMQIRIYRATANQRVIDCRLSLQALIDNVAIGGSNDTKGYGGFALRIEPGSGLQFVSNDGAVEPRINAIHAGAWIDVRSGKRAVAIVSHPDNPGFPEPWILRRTSSMQNPAFPGREPIALPQDDSLVLRYRLVIHRGDLQPVAIETISKEFATRD